MKKLLALIASITTIAICAQDSSRILTGSAQPPLPFNIVSQPGFEQRTVGWSATGGTFTTTSDSTLVARGRFSASFTLPASTAAGVLLQSDLVPVPVGLYGAQCRGRLLAKGLASTNGTLFLEGYDGTSTYGSVALSNYTNYTKVVTSTFTCPTSGSIRFRIRSTATSPSVPTPLYFDEAYLGDTDALGTVSLTSDVSGILPIANGGTNGTATPTNGGVAYGTGTAVAYSAAGTSGQMVISGGAGAPTFRTITMPTQQRFTSGTAATYTTPANVVALRVRMVGGGGGSDGTAGGTGGTVGTASSFGNLTANAGTRVTGGTTSIGAGWFGTGIAGGEGTSPAGVVNSAGGAGGVSFFGGAAGGAATTLAGRAPIANSGSGAGGAGGAAAAAGGSGGGAGGYVEAYTSGAPSATYTYTVGTGGAAGSAGGGQVGAAGATGYIEITEQYQ